MNRRWKNRPEGSNWGDFGADDQRGRLNLLTPEKVRQGAAEVRDGRSFCLSLPLDLPGGNSVNPKRHPPKLGPVWESGDLYFNYVWNERSPGMMDITSDEVISAVNSDRSATWKAGRNARFEHASILDAKILMGTKQGSPDTFLPARTVEEEPTPVALPMNFDWRTDPRAEKCPSLKEIRDQANCGSCWAFSSTGAVESAYHIKMNKGPSVPVT